MTACQHLTLVLCAHTAIGKIIQLTSVGRNRKIIQRLELVMDVDKKAISGQTVQTNLLDQNLLLSTTFNPQMKRDPLLLSLLITDKTLRTINFEVIWPVCWSAFRSNNMFSLYGLNLLGLNLLTLPLPHCSTMLQLRQLSTWHRQESLCQSLMLVCLFETRTAQSLEGLKLCYNLWTTRTTILMILNLNPLFTTGL